MENFLIKYSECNRMVRILTSQMFILKINLFLNLLKKHYLNNLAHYVNVNK